MTGSAYHDIIRRCVYTYVGVCVCLTVCFYSETLTLALYHDRTAACLATSPCCRHNILAGRGLTP